MEDEHTEELRQSFDFKYYLFISRVYQDTFQKDSKQAAVHQEDVKPRKRQKVSIPTRSHMILR